MADFHPIALLDMTAFLAALVGLIFLCKNWKRTFLREAKLLFVGLILFTLSYNFLLFLEWSSLATDYEIPENVIGALLPMWWMLVIYAFLQEITQRKLRNSEARYQDLYDNAPDMFVSVDAATAQILQCNRMLETVTGYAREEILGRSLWELYPADLRGKVKEAFETFRTTGQVKNVELQLQRRDGSTVDIVLNASAVRDKQGRILHSRSVLRDITEKKQAERALRFIRFAVEHSSDEAFWMGQDARFVYVNESACRKLGYKRDELLQLGVQDVDPDFPKEIWLQHWQELKEKKTLTFASHHRTKIGDIFPVEITANFVEFEGKEYNCAFARDVTERKEFEKKLQEKQRQLVTLMSNLPGMVYRCKNDPDWKMELISDGCYSLTGYKPEELIDNARLPYAELIHFEDRQMVWDTIQAALSEQNSFQLVYRITTANREEKWVWEQGQGVFAPDGELIALEGFITNITERKRAEQEREKLIAELELKNAELERFTYTVSHDLKSPLITTKGFIGMLEQDLAQGNQKLIAEDMQRISHATETMECLLDELLELSRIGRIVNPPEKVRLSELAQEALALLSGEPSAPNIQFEIDPDLPVVYGDRIRLREVLQNLIENAIKFMADQPEPRIEIGVRLDKGEDVFYVRDNGVGIESHFHEKIFGLFNKLNSEAAGTGIGLAIVKRIVEVHGGRIWVESQGIGHGSTFCFTLPKKQERE